MINKKTEKTTLKQAFMKVAAIFTVTGLIASVAGGFMKGTSEETPLQDPKSQTLDLRKSGGPLFSRAVEISKEIWDPDGENKNSPENSQSAIEPQTVKNVQKYQFQMQEAYLHKEYKDVIKHGERLFNYFSIISESTYPKNMNDYLGYAIEAHYMLGRAHQETQGTDRGHFKQGATLNLTEIPNNHHNPYFLITEAKKWPDSDPLICDNLYEKTKAYMNKIANGEPYEYDDKPYSDKELFKRYSRLANFYVDWAEHYETMSTDYNTAEINEKAIKMNEKAIEMMTKALETADRYIKNNPEAGSNITNAFNHFKNALKHFKNALEQHKEALENKHKPSEDARKQTKEAQNKHQAPSTTTVANLNIPSAP